jgi:ribonuclease P protein component
MQTFRKSERLSGEKLIDTLFTTGNTFVVSPFRVIWLEFDFTEKSPAKILISVSKKRIKGAVERNLVKRRIREAYRRNKKSFYDFLIQNKKKCVFALLYNTSEVLTYKETEGKIILLLNRLQSEYEKSAK